MTSDDKIFHIDLFGRFGLVTVVMFVPVLWVASDSFLTLLVAIAFVAAVEIGTYYFCTVVIGRNGIVLYRANKADWQDMTAAKPVSFLGLPYLKVQREKGIRWWIPLYLTEPNEFRQALITNAPAGNPLRKYADNDVSH